MQDKPVLSPPEAPEQAPSGTAGDAPSPDVLSVAELDRRIRRAVETLTTDLWIEGEVASFKAATSGHMYFTLKDEREDACIECVMYRSVAARGRTVLADGARVQVRGRATFWAPRGKLQFVVETARAAGRGALLEALERLRQRLASEGLFAADRKRILPPEPRIIGVVTSATGAAIHDIAKVAFRRGGARILLAPALVQGVEAPQRIIEAMNRLERVSEVDVIIIGRGGGAADDLSAFQDEALVRRVAACRVPVVSAVGHETDTTLTDLVADARAATPSQAAEMLVPDLAARGRLLQEVSARLLRAMRARIAEDRLALERMRRVVGDPRAQIGERVQLLDDLQGRVREAVRKAISARRTESLRLGARLSARHPAATLANARSRVGPLDERLRAAARHTLERGRGTLCQEAARLHELSPLAVLSRGYAVALRTSGEPILDAQQASQGEVLHLRLHRGQLAVRVEDASLREVPS